MPWKPSIRIGCWAGTPSVFLHMMLNIAAIGELSNISYVSYVDNINHMLTISIIKDSANHDVFELHAWREDYTGRSFDYTTKLHTIQALQGKVNEWIECKMAICRDPAARGLHDLR